MLMINNLMTNGLITTYDFTVNRKLPRLFGFCTLGINQIHSEIV